MQRLLAYFSSFYPGYLWATFEPSVDSWKLQAIIERICPRLNNAKIILVSMIRALTPSRYLKEMTHTIVEQAAKITREISDLVGTVEGSPQIHHNILLLEEILRSIQSFVLSETQATFVSKEDLSVQHDFLAARLMAVLETFKKAVSKPDPLADIPTFGLEPKSSHDIKIKDCAQPARQTSSEVASVAATNFKMEGETHDGPSLFRGAHDIVIKDGKYFIISGNYIDGGASPRPLNGIVMDLPVVTRENISLEDEIDKGYGYRFYSARISGKVVAMKVYEGSHAKERCLEAAKLLKKVFHPNIARLIGVSPLGSDNPFLVFDGDYEGRLDYILRQVLKKDLKQSLILGIQTVIGLSSSLDYLHDQDYPIASMGIGHFVPLIRHGRIIITFNPEELDHMTQIESHRRRDASKSMAKALNIFNGLCEMIFNAACEAHYEGKQTQHAHINESDASVSEDDISDDELGPDDTRQRRGHIEPDLRSVDLVPAPSLAMTGTSPKRSLQKPSPKISSRKLHPNGRRQELVWKPLAEETIPLHEISREFQYLLKANSSSLQPDLNRRHGRHMLRTSHRCPGYKRVEITLTTDISRIAIVSHSSPIPHEICPVCREVVKYAEIFSCICGREDHESVPTVKCSRCSVWHHRPCVNFSDLESRKFVCGGCERKQDLVKSPRENQYQGSIDTDFLQPPNATSLLSSLPPDGPVITFNIHNARCDALAVIAGIDEPLHIPLENFSLVQAERLQKTLQCKLLKRRGVETLQLEFGLLEQWKVEEDHRPGVRHFIRNLPSMSFVLKELWCKVVQPILEVLGYSTEFPPNPSDRRRIWWCPTGPLAFLPLHAAGIYSSAYRSGSCISDFVVSSYTPTVRSLNDKFIASSTSSRCTSLVLISQPNTPGLSSIPATRTEVHTLEALMKGTAVDALLLEDSKATIERVKAEMKSRSWVHFACHGVQDVHQPLESGLCLHDGRLELREIINQQIPNPDLAFLSACQSSEGDLKLSEEVVHLAPGMLAAGYRGVVGPMWEISDMHAPEFATEFYKYLLREKGLKEGLDSTRAAYALDYATMKVRESLGEGEAALLTWVPYVHFGY
ncbi:CHAT domain-containing protein [Flammula alnicola]|nr:CHAT domain-containing protein [Flammula alnicola]